MEEDATTASVRRVLAEIREAAERSGRDAAALTLVGVCKTVGRDEVQRAYEAGVRHFGENRVQEAAAKFSTPLPPGASLHMIGQLQTNKAHVAVRLFDLIESVDRPSLVAELEKQGAKLGKRIPVLLQVNIAGEARKAGCEPADAASIARAIVTGANLELRGLMTIAPLVDDPEAVRPVFRGLREVGHRLRHDLGIELPVLSMGMSNDFRVAIAEGATQVRIGRALFHD